MSVRRCVVGFVRRIPLLGLFLIGAAAQGDDIEDDFLRVWNPIWSTEVRERTVDKACPEIIGAEIRAESWASDRENELRKVLDSSGVLEYRVRCGSTLCEVKTLGTFTPAFWEYAQSGRPSESLVLIQGHARGQVRGEPATASGRGWGHHAFLKSDLYTEKFARHVTKLSAPYIDSRGRRLWPMPQVCAAWREFGAGNQSG